jgi:chromatin assembly factor 1 subunit B
LPGFTKSVVGVRFNPKKFSGGVSGEYVYVYAVFSLDQLAIYRTDMESPIALIGNMHYSPLTDASWSCDGLHIFMSSTDGFCSLVEFSDGELGDYYLEKATDEDLEQTNNPIIEHNHFIDLSTTTDKPLLESKVLNENLNEPMIAIIENDILKNPTERKEKLLIQANEKFNSPDLAPLVSQNGSKKRIAPTFLGQTTSIRKQ